MNRGTVVMWALVAAGVPSAVAQAAQSIPTASLAIVSPSDASQEITEGDENTHFVIRPPDGAACPGDTQHDGWQLAGFILPEEEDPANQIFTALGPVERYVDDVTRRLALYRVERSPVGLANLPRNEVAGQPGLIPAIPTLSFQQVATLGLAGGRYQLGIACVFDGTQLGDYWTAIVTITRPTDLKSTELSWTVEVAAPAPESSDRSSTTILLVATALVGAGAIGYFIFRLRKGK